MLNRLRFLLARFANPLPGEQPAAGHYRDVPSRHHFSLRLKPRARNRNISVSPPDPREHLVRFLGTFGPRTLGRDATLEALTLLEETTCGGRYLAAFAGGARMIWTVGQAADGTITSLDGTSAP